MLKGTRPGPLKSIETMYIGIEPVGFLVKVYTTQGKKGTTISFKELHSKDLGEVGERPYCKKEGKEIPPEEIIKGYEIYKGEYVPFTPKELEELKSAERTFVPLGFMPRLVVAETGTLFIEPEYTYKTYVLGPVRFGEKRYVMFRDYLKRKRECLLGEYEEHLGVIRPYGEILVMDYVYQSDQVTDPKSVRFKELETVKVTGREQKLYDELMSELHKDWNISHEKARNTFRERITERIKLKIAGKKIEPLKPELKEEITAKLLQESIKAIKSRGQKKIDEF